MNTLHTNASLYGKCVEDTLSEKNPPSKNIRCKLLNGIQLKCTKKYKKRCIMNFRTFSKQASQTYETNRNEEVAMFPTNEYYFFPMTDKPKCFQKHLVSSDGQTDTSKTSKRMLSRTTMTRNDISERNWPNSKASKEEVKNFLPMLNGGTGDTSTLANNKSFFLNKGSAPNAVFRCSSRNSSGDYIVELPLDNDLIYPLRGSLFPNVPPYLAFASSTDKIVKPPKEIRKTLHWKVSDLTPPIVTTVVRHSGFKLTEDETSWFTIWGKQLSCHKFCEFEEYQKINHFPGTYHLGRKDKLWLNIAMMQMIHGKERFSFMPQTFVLPRNLKELREAWFAEGNQTSWIIKPPAASRGEGISIVHRWSDIPKKEHVIVQRYISKPYLINNTKFDLRLYILVTSFNPLRLYLYEDGLVRFASESYSNRFRNLGKNFIHLTNYSINCTNLHYTTNEDENVPQGHKWSLKCLWSYFRKNGVNEKKVWASLVDVVVKTLISCEDPISKIVGVYAKNRYCCYELFGFDIIFDHMLKPWLLEVNISPSLHTDSQLDLKIKGELVRDMFNTVGFHIPEEIQLNPRSHLQLYRRTGIHPKSNISLDRHLYTFGTTYEDRIKQAKYINGIPIHLPILKNLTTGDIKQLVQSEDELARCGRFVRIFPSNVSSPYLALFRKQKYYNLLLDAWEKKYHRRRQAGILFLQSFCSQKIHLQPADMEENQNNVNSVPSKETSISLNTNHQLNSLYNNKELCIEQDEELETEKLRSDSPRVSFLPFITNRGDITSESETFSLFE